MPNDLSHKDKINYKAIEKMFHSTVMDWSTKVPDDSKAISAYLEMTIRYTCFFFPQVDIDTRGNADMRIDFLLFDLQSTLLQLQSFITS